MARHNAFSKLVKMLEENRSLALFGTLASLIGLGIALLSLLGLPGRDAQDTLARIRSTGRLRVGYIPYYDISSREAQSGAVRGFLVDVLYKVAEDLGVTENNIEFIETDWQNFGLGLRDGKYDLSIAGTFITPERARIASFTDALFYLGNGALVRTTENRFHSIDDFNRPDVTIAVVQGEQGYEYARRYLTKAHHKILTGADLDLACLEVAKGRADAALSDQYILRRYTQTHPVVKDALANNPYYVLPIAWAVRKSDKEWLEYLNTQLKSLKSSGWLRRLQANYPMVPWATPTAKAADLPDYHTSRWGLLTSYANAFLQGILTTLFISFFAIILGTLVGTLLALFLASSRQGPGITILRNLVKAYVYSFLAIPALVLIIIFYYSRFTSGLNSAVAAIIALGLNLSPFAAKIIAAGIKNIPSSYLRAAKSFGYSDREITIKFKFPLVRQNSIQPLLVQWFTTVKLSSLASVIGVTEVLHRSQQVIRETYQTEQAYLALVLCYMLIVIPIAATADYYENKTTLKSGGHG